MKLQDYLSSLNDARPPERCSPYLTALWRERRGDWEAAHRIVQDIDDRSAAWIHAYLHRREGDQSNAAYWYRQADRPFPNTSLDEEWDAIVEGLVRLEIDLDR
jgi:hypothetical protein